MTTEGKRNFYARLKMSTSYDQALERLGFELGGRPSEIEAMRALTAAVANNPSPDVLADLIVAKDVLVDAGRSTYERVPKTAATPQETALAMAFKARDLREKAAELVQLGEFAEAAKVLEDAHDASEVEADAWESLGKNDAAKEARRQAEAVKKQLAEAQENVKNPPLAKEVNPNFKEVSFAEAKGKGGIPGNVEWVFMTEKQRSKGNGSGEDYQKYDNAWVVYGRTVDSHVFVSVEDSYHTRENYNTGPGGYGMGFGLGRQIGHSLWTMRVDTYGISTQASPSWLVGNISKGLSNLSTFSGRFNNKVIDITGKDPFASKEAFGRAEDGRGTSIKNVLVAIGEVDTDDASVANRKISVEIEVENDHFYGRSEPKAGFYPAKPDKSNTWDGVYHGDYYQIKLIIAGKEYALNEEDTQRVIGLRAGGKAFVYALFGRIYGRKMITRMGPKAKPILEALVKVATGLPGPAKEMLSRAIEQMTK